MNFAKVEQCGIIPPLKTPAFGSVFRRHVRSKDLAFLSEPRYRERKVNGIRGIRPRFAHSPLMKGGRPSNFHWRPPFSLSECIQPGGPFPFSSLPRKRRNRNRKKYGQQISQKAIALKLISFDETRAKKSKVYTHSHFVSLLPLRKSKFCSSPPRSSKAEREEGTRFALHAVYLSGTV